MVNFCPSEVAWGNIATWFTGFATLAAVGVALRNARNASRLAAELHEREKEDQKRRDVSTARRLAIVMDYELFMWGGTLRTIARETYPSDLDMILTAEHMLPNNPLPMTSRFAPELGVFSDEDAAAIIKVLTQAQRIDAAPKPEGIDQAPEEVKRIAAEAILQTLQRTLSLVDDARERLAPWLIAQGMVPADLHEVGDQIDLELRSNN